MTMAFLQGELLKSDNPADWQAAQVVGALLASRGGVDIPLPGDTPEQQPATDIDQARRDAAELIGLSVVDRPADDLADSVAAHTQAGQELALYSKPEVTTREIVTALQIKEEREQERALFNVVADKVSSLIPHETLLGIEGNKGAFGGLIARDIQHLKQLQSVVFFPYDSIYYMPQVVIGWKWEEGSKHANMLSYDLVRRQAYVYAVNKADLATFQALPSHLGQEQGLNAAALQKALRPDGTFVLQYNTPGTVCKKNNKRLFGGEKFRDDPPDLQRIGLRLIGDSGLDHIDPGLTQLTSEGRLPKNVVESYGVGQQLAHLKNALSR